jgi:hypothetical protein
VICANITANCIAKLLKKDPYGSVLGVVLVVLCSVFLGVKCLSSGHLVVISVNISAKLLNSSLSYTTSTTFRYFCDISWYLSWSSIYGSNFIKFTDFQHFLVVAHDLLIWSISSSKS